MTFADDCMRFNFLGGNYRLMRCKEMGIDWPPPAHLEFCGFPFTRSRMSDMSDDTRRAIGGVVRLAEYEGSEAPSLR